MNNAMTEMMQALEQGDLALIDQLLESFLMKELPEEIYALAEVFMQYGYMKEARVYWSICNFYSLKRHN
ncbi:hypothetical protein LSPH24S_04563 [Lysinibacillus sphaericus]